MSDLRTQAVHRDLNHRKKLHHSSRLYLNNSLLYSQNLRLASPLRVCWNIELRPLLVGENTSQPQDKVLPSSEEVRKVSSA